MHLRSRRARLLAAASALLVPVGVLATIQPAAAAPTGLVTIDSTLPRWLAKTKAQSRVAVPDAPADQKLAIRVYLAPQGGADALAKAALAVSTPGSATYGQFLTADQYHATYAPSAAAEKTVRSFLTSKGITVSGTAPFRRYVTATGTVKQLDDAFAVSLKKLTNGKQKVVAPTTAAALPAKVASQVLTIDGLDTTKVTMKHASDPKVDPPTGFKNARPCSKYFGQLDATTKGDFKTPLPKFKNTTLSYVPCGYAGPLLRKTYAQDSDLTGKGATIAITDAYRWQLMAKDASRYATEHGDAAWTPGQFSENLPAAYTDEEDCDASGWSGEETLDVESAHAIAPDAKIRYYGSASCNDDDFLDALARVADEDVAQVVSNSWADGEYAESSEAVAAYEVIFQQNALQGISTMFSSGDDGDELARTDFKQVNYPSSDPYVTGVGGTSTGIDYDGTRLFDYGWGTHTWSLSSDGKSWTPGGFQAGAGGGVSSLFEQPAYQKGVVTAQLSNGRAVPDIAMDADAQTGMLVGQTQTFSNGTYYSEFRLGGTSLASPLLAGMTALAVQNNGGRGLGLLNPVIYKKSSIVDDVLPVVAPNYGVVRVNYVNNQNADKGTTYLVRTFGQDSSLKITKGWDQVTGRGVPNGNFLKLTTPAPTAAVVKR